MRLPAASLLAKLGALARRPWCFAFLFWAVALVAAYLVADLVAMPLVARKFAFRQTVPEVVGMERAEAEKRLADEHLGFRWAKEGRYSPDVPAGHVLLQIPGPGREVKRGRTVFLTPSKGVREVAVPNLRGQSQRQASLSIQRLGLVRGPDVPGGHVSIPYNVIIRTIPGSGELVRVGDTVSLVVSRGMTAGRTVLPDVRKLPMETAAAKLDSLGFAVAKELSGTPPKDTSFAPGSVLEQRPMGGEYLTAGDTIHLVGAP